MKYTSWTHEEVMFKAHTQTHPVYVRTRIITSSEIKQPCRKAFGGM